ncbi:MULTISPECIES: DNA mismatch repair endonuclease MutL [Sporosarcina]|uniref:DNA mismatch repair protein MutL n=2 Tax=Sporosarcina newyorkensis TaxID=759851 RepID=A0A1T4YDC4_9BACL|nr:MULTISPECIES: DNA mismatch repair endonuclease MutL [Sporosarcina]EGQ27443.1 DNA mismatch repair protein MutL [Sporosarcina newyorkensis 2681]MBY0221984.1 DNA mismatch repair endonuclease MutL [Sporosarcina aquimarina]SKA99827.1 DNA mismatch repair protein MutL [Sporosarcina newyorkensis]
MNHIHIMEDTLANKIAAGEVVERPASIVKELVENAIDAQSTQIEVTLEEAGLTSIRVTDNGKGMSEEDAIRCFERHATSKISNEHDLFRIRTLGFRGEALASIAAVSKVSLWTSDGEDQGTVVEIEGGKVLKHEPGALRKGTDFTIQQLFFNTPARLKYMKTIQTELGHTIDLLNRLALSHPDIAFTLTHDQHQILRTSGSGNLLRVLSDIYGVSVARKMIPFEKEDADFKVNGFITLPELNRASKNYVSLLMNGRWIKSYPGTQAVIDALHTYLPIGRFPIAVVNIMADPILTDVNVHPAKRHIRISKESELFTLIKEAIREAIQKASIIPDAIKKEKLTKTDSEQQTIWSPSFRRQEAPARQQQVLEPVVPAKPVQNPFSEITEPEFPEAIFEQHDEPPTEEPIHNETETETSLFPSIVPIGQVHGTYIVAQNEDGFYMIDQHAAQERIKYEYFKKKLGQVSADERQQLLLPLVFHYSADEQVKIEECKEALERVGVFLEAFGPATYTVKEYPAWFPEGQATAIIEEMIEQVLHSRKVDVEKLREESAILMSCKRSIKANYYLTQADMERLLDDLGKCHNPYTCPHGRPVLIHFTTYELEKMFKRVM